MTDTPIFKRGQKLTKLDIAKAMGDVERDYGIGRYRQVWEILKLRLGRKKGQAHEYYLNGFFRPDLSKAQKDKLFTLRSIKELNDRLSPRDLGAMPALLEDKILCEKFLVGFGFPVPGTLATFGEGLGYPGLKHLTTKEGLIAFLKDAKYPIFGKAASQSLGIGTAILQRLEGDTLHFGNGESHSVDAFANEVATHMADGYIFQPFVRQRPEAEEVTGLAVGIIRVVTLLTSEGPELFYTLWRLPARGAMSDGALGDGIEGGATGAAYIDPATSKVTALGFGSTPSAPPEVSDVTGAQVLGREIPDLGAITDLCCEIHRAFPTHGVLGFDVIQGMDGPVICEINSNPHHSILNKALGGPFEDSERLNVLERALSFVEVRRANSDLSSRANRRRIRKGNLAELGFKH